MTKARSYIYQDIYQSYDILKKSFEYFNIGPESKDSGPIFGGGGESRTPVRKRFNRNFSGRRRFFRVPFPEREPSRSEGR